MELQQFEQEFKRLGANPKTAAVDKFNKTLIKNHITDVSFLRPILPEHPEYYRTYFQVSILTRNSLEDKFAFIEDNFDLLHDWWHVDGLMVFLGNALNFSYAYEKAKVYVESELPYVRRFGYVMFIPRLVRDKENIDKLTALLKNDEAYHVIMGEAWLISFLAMCDAEKTHQYLKTCDLKYNIVGKAIQKICDSYVISDEDKEKFKRVRAERKENKYGE